MNTPSDFFEYVPVAGQDGWFTWDMKDKTKFNAQAIGPLMVRQEGRKCRLRMMPEQQHGNVQEMVHGGATLALIDISLFSAMYILCENAPGSAVTLELSTQFIGAGKLNEPLDSVVEIMRETGRLLFLRGEVMQEDHLVASFSGLVRKGLAAK